MGTQRLFHRLAIAAGGTAIIAMVSLTAGCGEEHEKKEGPETSTSTTTTTTTTPTSTPESTTPEVSPSEKSINPTGGNLFTPGHMAPAAPTATPGHHN